MQFYNIQWNHDSNFKGTRSQSSFCLHVGRNTKVIGNHFHYPPKRFICGLFLLSVGQFGMLYIL